MNQQRGNRQRQTTGERQQRQWNRERMGEEWNGMGNMTRREREEWTQRHEGMNPQEWRETGRECECGHHPGW